MRSFFENIKTIIGESIGMVGGFIWAKNSKWDYEPIILFSVSGVGFIVSIISLFFKKEEIVQPLQPNNVADNFDNLNITDIESKAIFKEIENVPLYQQQSIAEHYIGINVKWVLKLFMIHKGKNNYISVVMNEVSSRYSFPNISFDVDINDYPIFKIAKEGKHFEVVGKICKCEQDGITLKPYSIKEL